MDKETINKIFDEEVRAIKLINQDADPETQVKLVEMLRDEFIRELEAGE